MTTPGSAALIARLALLARLRLRWLLGRSAATSGRRFTTLATAAVSAAPTAAAAATAATAAPLAALLPSRRRALAVVVMGRTIGRGLAVRHHLRLFSFGLFAPLARLRFELAALVVGLFASGFRLLVPRDAVALGRSVARERLRALLGFAAFFTCGLLARGRTGAILLAPATTAAAATPTAALPAALPVLSRALTRRGLIATLPRFGLGDGLRRLLGTLPRRHSLGPLGGIRAIGPLTSPDQTHAVDEWAGQPSQPLVRKMIADRIPFGVVEMKTAWVTTDGDRNRRLTASLARTGCQVLAALDVQFGMATCAQHVLARWRSSGGVVAPIRSTPYPDERFRTKLMWWDRRTVANLAAPDQTAKIVAEMEHIHARLNEMSRYVRVGS